MVRVIMMKLAMMQILTMLLVLLAQTIAHAEVLTLVVHTSLAQELAHARVPKLEVLTSLAKGVNLVKLLD